MQGQSQGHAGTEREQHMERDLRKEHVRASSRVPSSTVWNCAVQPAPFRDPVRRTLPFTISYELQPFSAIKMLFGPHLPSFPLIPQLFRTGVALLSGSPFGVEWGSNGGRGRQREGIEVHEFQAQEIGSWPEDHGEPQKSTCLSS